MTVERQVEPEWDDGLTSRAYCITVDDGRDRFYALSIEDDSSPDAWVISDTVRALDSMR